MRDVVVASGVKFSAPGVGGDLDVVGATEGRLIYLELESSPPKHLSDAEVGAFFERVHLLCPDVTVFAMDTALRLSDKVVVMLAGELARRSPSPRAAPHRVERKVWALTPHLYAVNARPDLVGNIGRALGEGLRALAPENVLNPPLPTSNSQLRKPKAESRKPDPLQCPRASMSTAICRHRPCRNRATLSSARVR